jgi:hypothetical protein
MRSRYGPLLDRVLVVSLFLVLVLPVLAVLGSAGCAHPRPCLVIPKQIELATYARDQVRTQVDAKTAEVSRSKENLDMARTRLTQMEQEKAELEKTLAQQAADSAAAGRKK